MRKPGVRSASPPDKAVSTSESRVPESRCLVCGASRHRMLFVGTEERFGHGGSFTVASCEQCGFAWTSLDPDVDLGDWYERSYWGNREDGGDRNGHARGPAYRALRAVWRAINGTARPSRWVKRGRVLDVGYGPGYDTLEMQEQGARVIGIDISSAGLRGAGGLRPPVARAVANACPFADGSFDTVVMSQVLEHLSDPVGALAEARRILRPGGRLLVLVPNAAGVQRHVFRNHWVNWHLPYHIWHFEASTAIALVTRCGFRVKRVRTYSPGEWLLLSLRLTWPSLGSVEGNRPVSRALRLIAAPLLRMVDCLGLGDCLVVEVIKV